MNEIEAFARAWIVCDPNRGGDDDGLRPDDIMRDASGDLKDQPRWKWFIPRAEATIKFLRENGYEVRHAKG